MRTKRGARNRGLADRLSLVLFVAGLSLLAPSCAERRSPEEPRISGHPEEFSRASSADFHGDRVRWSGDAACETCHGADLAGDAGTRGCFDCHDGPGGHPRNWIAAGAPEFHGDAVAAGGPGACEDCHGTDLLGGWSGVSCGACHDGPGGHPEGWLNPNASSFHGRRAFVEGPNACARCHGFPPSRGTSGVSCADCHV